MSYDIWLEIDTGGDELAIVHEVGNYTSNVSRMWTDALGGKMLREFHGMSCRDAVAPLVDGVSRMEADTEKYRAMNPANNWGNYEGALGYLKDLAEACAQHPLCTIHVYA